MITFKRNAENGYTVYKKASGILDGTVHQVARIFLLNREWILMSNTGRTDRFDTLKEAKDEALKI